MTRDFYRFVNISSPKWILLYMETHIPLIRFNATCNYYQIRQNKYFFVIQLIVQKLFGTSYEET